MIHNHERLLVKLIEQYHGLVPSLTAQLLLHHGSILMKRALASSKLNTTDFKRGLDVLVRCNLAKITTIKRQQIVDIFSDKIYNMLYYPHYLVIIKKRFGVESVSLLRTLILYGNLPVEDLIERTLFHIVKSNSLDIVEEQMKLFIRVLFEKYKELCSRRIICPVDKSSSPPDECNVDMIFKTLQRRFEDSTTQHGPICSGSKWSFDCKVLNYLLFIELFPYFANQPFANEEASFLFNLLLELTFEKSFAMKKTPLTFSEVHARYASKFPVVSINRLASILRTFSYFFAPNFVQVEKMECFLNFDVFLHDIVQMIVKEFVKKNFGENAVRIFGALLEESCVFENSLLNSLKMDSKELHRNLYQLDLNRMINITFYSEAGASQSSTILARNVKKAFSVNLNDVVHYVLSRCHYSLYTLMHRRNIEMNEQKDLISRKTYIENYKRDITATVDEEGERKDLIKIAHNYMSENDHTKADKLLSYDSKVNQIDYNLINYVFILNMWKEAEASRARKGQLEH